MDSGRPLLIPLDTPGQWDEQIVGGKADGVAAATINREVGLLSAAINYARREWDWDIPNPAARRKLKVPEGRVRWLSRAEAAALLSAAGRDLLGHSSVTMTERYAHLAPENVRAAVTRLEDG